MKIIQDCKNLIKEYIQVIMLDFYFPRIYRTAAKREVNPSQVIFLEDKKSDIPDSFKLLYARLQNEYVFDVEFISLEHTHINPIAYYKNCARFLRKAATAKYIFLNDASNIVSCVPIRDETKVVQLWHACGAFKKWGMSTADLKFGGTREQLLKHPYYKNLSLVTVSSPEVIWAYAEAMVLEDQKEIIKPLGVSRTDVFFNQEYLFNARRQIENVVGPLLDKKIILYAPTFRGRVANAKAPNALDIGAMSEALSDDYVLIIKHHPFVKNLPPIPESCRYFAFDVTQDIDIDILLSCADICISDYSSLVFEYSLFEKPMIFFAFDIEQYNDWRGFFYEYDELTPGPVFSTSKQVIDYIKRIETLFDKSIVQDFKKRFMSACDGESTSRIMFEVFGRDVLIRNKKK